jgi:competence protein ComEA
MRRALASDHDAAVARRLELLTAELATVRDDGRDAAVRPPAVPAEPQGGAPPVPVEPPGRHASRRSSVASWRPPGDRDWRRGLLLGSGQLAVVAVVAAVGLLLACWWLLHTQSHEVAAPVSLTTSHARLPTPVSAVGSAPVVAPASSGVGRARLVVDVVGRVRRPGITVLHSGDRVVDAIRAAGGARRGVDLSALNLARMVTDGEQIVVGAPAAPSLAVPTGVGASAPAGSPGAGLVDINTADETALESLPEVGPVTAQAIIAWRSEHGGFTAVSQLLDVDGIGDATLAKLTPYVTV